MINTYCEHCGASTKEYKHNLSVGLVKSLARFALASKNKPVLALKEVGFDTNSFNNFQKLQYFRLVEKVEGGWTLTEKGRLFLLDKVPVPASVVTFRNEVKGTSGITVFMPEVIRDPFWQTDFTKAYSNQKLI